MKFELKTLALALGSVIAVINLVAMLAPGPARQVLDKFPRSKAAAWILLLLVLPWAAYMLADMPPFAGNENLQSIVYLATPITFFLLIFFMDELLAPRALGGVLLLLADPVLDAARWHPGNARLVMTVLAYIWVIVGMILILSPFRFRHAVAWRFATDGRARLVGLVGVTLGLVVVGLGALVY